MRTMSTKNRVGMRRGPVALLLAVSAVTAATPVGAGGAPVRAFPQSGPARIVAGAAGPCADAPAALCLLDGRFELTVTWRNQFDGSSGAGRAVEETDFAGFFYFTDAANLELLVKMLDFGDSVKLFYGQLTNLRFELRVRETASGEVRVYENGPSECGAIDQGAFPGAVGGWVPKRGNLASAGSCIPSPTRLCLLTGRIAVEVGWRNHYNGTSGAAAQRELSDLSGLFTYDDPRNVELVTKALDFGNKILFLYGALSDLEYTIRLEDTVTGKRKTYRNPPGRFCGGIDNDVLADEEPEPTTGPVGPDGGLWVGLDGAVEVLVPPGALSETVQLTATRRTAAQLGIVEPAIDEGSLILLGPAGVRFALPATARLRYDPARMPPGLQPEQIAPRELVAGVWQELEDAATDGGARLTAGSLAATGGVLAAGVATAKAPCLGPEHRQFDFWLGEWDWTQSLPPGNTSVGRQRITRDDAGCFIYEHFTNGGGVGRSINFYDPVSQTWSETYVDNSYAYRFVGVGRLEGGRMVMYRPGVPERHTWDPLDANHVRYFAEGSNNGGVTWQVGFDSTYTRR